MNLLDPFKRSVSDFLYKFLKPQSYSIGFDVGKPLTTPTPKILATPTPKVLAASTGLPSNYQHNIPYSPETGVMRNVPANIAQPLMEVFDPIGAATESASVLSHPNQKVMLDSEMEQLVKNRGTIYNQGWSAGENRGFKTGKEIDIPNKDGSIDRGLFRINSNTFNSWVQNPKSRQTLIENGITKWDDMLDPKKNMIFAKLLMQSTPTKNPSDRSWRKWWGAPLLVRHPSLKNTQ